MCFHRFSSSNSSRDSRNHHHRRRRSGFHRHTEARCRVPCKASSLAECALMSTLIVEASLLHMTRRPVPATRLVELFKVPTLTGLYFCICFLLYLERLQASVVFLLLHRRMGTRFSRLCSDLGLAVPPTTVSIIYRLCFTTLSASKCIMTRPYATSSAHSTPLAGLSFTHLPECRTAFHGMVYMYGLRRHGKASRRRVGEKSICHCSPHR
jgi:hypothetical protein